MIAHELNLETVNDLDHLEFLAAQVVEGFITGMHKSPFHGFSVEFSEHRLYNQGESVKNIDWKLYARTEKLFTKRFEEETNLRCQIVIDGSQSMYFPSEGLSKIRFAILAAASIMRLMRKQRDAVGLHIFDEQLRFSLPAKSSQTHHKLLGSHLINLLTPDSKPRKTSAITCLHELAETMPRRSLVMLFSDLFDDPTQAEQLYAALQHLRYNKHEVILFHVLEQSKEILFNFENNPHIFIDAETGETIKLNPANIATAYRESMENYKQSIKIKCGQFGIDYFEASLAGDLNQLLLAYFIKRTKLY